MDYILNLLTKIHEDGTINVASRVLTIHIIQNAPPPDGHVCQQTRIILELNQDFIGTYVLIWKNSPPNGGHVFQRSGTIFDLVQDSIGKNLVTMCHEDRTINVASRVLTRKNTLPPGGYDCQATKTITINVASRVLTMKNTLPPGGHVFRPNGIIFKVVQYIIRTNLESKFHEDWTINVASRVLTSNRTIFKLFQDIVETNLLTKCHEDLTTNVASIVLTRQILTTHNAQFTYKKRSQSSP
ncbi:hypothetical protein DPMN_151002 [Dreissena polymorpha]|uniref:Uncharacterized protein n=1 Tax=Dreissena polymorpha TaxID=45954 RepID=A0A9D4J2K3_DREPO|nr:hypothetical protein DPMN_150999 [Dreissena polymorpha]KAH3797421.1 hypothetical protein DPMN_151002 [Dreissena polymorpha]